jgi:cytosine/adenosine deaminase-related metal-dependent hydrolase
MKFFTADRIFNNTGPYLTNKTIVTDDRGEILDIVDSNSVSADVKKINGAIVPGFVNAHCHLELSHLKDQLDTGTGLIPFIRSVVTLRDFPEDIIQEAIMNADREMYRNGIVAVGDISNKSDTAPCKLKSKINYYTFVEMFDFLQEDQAEIYFNQYLNTFHAHSNQGNFKKSCAPHAPYSVSRKLFDLINKFNPSDCTVSIHNEETIAENTFFIDKTGEFLDFYSGFGINLEDFRPIGKTSIHYALKHMNPNNRTLFVHNTLSETQDIKAAQNWNKNSYWVTCPNANLYIENRLPDYRKFVDQNAKMAVGTDSLSSNWQLSVLEELKTIQRYQSWLDTETLIKWSSYYGAEALGFDEFGSISKGKKPGLVALESRIGDQFKLDMVNKCYRLI